MWSQLDFCAAEGVGAVLVLHSKGRRFELFRLVGGRLLPVSPGASGAVGSDGLGIRRATVGRRIRITWPEGSADI